MQFIIYGSIQKLPYWIGGSDLSHSFLLLMQTKILLTWQVEFPFLCITQRQKSVLQTIEYQIDMGYNNRFDANDFVTERFNSIQCPKHLIRRQIWRQNNLVLKMICRTLFRNLMFSLFDIYCLSLFSCQSSSIPTKVTE